MPAYTIHMRMHMHMYNVSDYSIAGKIDIDKKNDLGPRYFQCIKRLEVKVLRRRTLVISIILPTTLCSLYKQKLHVHVHVRYHKISN